MLLSKYGSSISFIYDMYFLDALELIDFSFEKAQKEKLYQLWLVLVPNWKKEDFLEFTEFCDAVKQSNTYYNIRTDDAVEEILRITEMMKGG